MSIRTFFDSNVLVYLDDATAPTKQQVAYDLFAEHRRAGSAVVSIQVLQEYFVTVTRKLHVDVLTARRAVELFARANVMVPDGDDILGAIDLHRLHNFSFWDALIIRSAKQAGCNVLLTEDLQHGQEIEDLEIVNPFR